MPVIMKRADELKIGDVFSTDGYAVEAATILLGGGAPGEVWVQTRRADDPLCKSAYLPLDFPCPIWTADEDQPCRGCARPFDSEADFCPECAAENAGEWC